MRGEALQHAPSPARARGGADLCHGLRPGGAQVSARWLWHARELWSPARGVSDQRRWDLDRYPGGRGRAARPGRRANHACRWTMCSSPRPRPCRPSWSSASPMATRTSWWRGAAMAALCRSWIRPPGAAGQPADSSSTRSTSTPCRFPPLPGGPGLARMNASTCCTTAWRGWDCPAAPRRACSMPRLRIRDGAPSPPWTRRCAWSPPWCALAGYAAVSRQGACLRRAWPTHRPTQQTTCRGMPVAFWSVQPAPPGPEGEEQLLLRGAVLVRIRGRRAVDSSVSVDGLSEPGGATVPALA